MGLVVRLLLLAVAIVVPGGILIVIALVAWRRPKPDRTDPA